MRQQIIPIAVTCLLLLMWYCSNLLTRHEQETSREEIAEPDRMGEIFITTSPVDLDKIADEAIASEQGKPWMMPGRITTKALPMIRTVNMTMR